MDRLDDMRLLVEAIDLGSFVAAGRRLGLSPASVSRRFKDLEADLGVRLVDRTTRRLALTDAGLEFYSRARDILARSEELKRTVSGLRDEPAGKLRVVARRSFALLHVAPTLSDFCRAYPAVHVDLSLTEIPNATLDPGVDVVIRLNAPQEKSLAVRRLAGGRRVLCASPDYLRTAPALRTPSDLAAHRCLAYRIAFESARWRFRAGSKTTELELAGTLLSNSGEVLRIAACNGLGVTLLPEWLVGADIDSGALVACLPEYEAHPIGYDADIFAIWRRGSFVPAKITAFLDHLVGHLSERAWFDGD